jgi:cyclopropane-fatty-acyl-phospholipid synthase
MNPLLQKVVSPLVSHGCLTVTDPDGEEIRFGDGTGQAVHVVIHTPRAMRAIALDPMLAFPEAYMDGEADIVEGDIVRLLQIVYDNFGPAGVERGDGRARWRAMRYGLRRVHQLNTAGAGPGPTCISHYDLSGELYRLFLDDGHAVFLRLFRAAGHVAGGGAGLAKKRHLAAKLADAGRPAQRARHRLGLGRAWGSISLSQFEAERAGRDALDRAACRLDPARRAGRASRGSRPLRAAATIATFQERFDRIVSVGMFEHVGVNHFRTYLRQMRPRC